MSTKIAIFREGIIIQVAHPLELYNNPANLYVADFIGNPRINFVDGKAEVSASGLTVKQRAGPDDIPGRSSQGREYAAGSIVRCSARHSSGADCHQHLASVPVRHRSAYLHLDACRLRDSGHRQGRRREHGHQALGITHYSPDQVVYLSIDTTKINVFDKKTENLIKYSVE